MLDLQMDFPLLDRRIGGRRIVYLDSAATSLTPRSVLTAQLDFAANIGATVRRSRHALGEEASFAFTSARRCVARFINADPACVVFTPGATTSINIVARGLRIEDRILMPSTEHHSNLVPWTQTGQAVVFDCDPRQQLPPERLEAEIKRHRAKLVALCFVSNVTGVMQDVPELCARARALGAVTVVDASQAVAHIPIDVVALNADFVAFSGHKMLGPSGIGVLWGRREILEKVAPLTVGGGSVAEVTVEGYTLAKLPERLEAGTPNITGVIGLAAAIDYIESLGWEPLRTHEAELAACLEAELAATPKIRPLMAHGPARIALGSFTLEDGSLTVDRLSSILSDTDNIMVRSGFHCAHPLFAREGGGGGLRVSAYIYNSKHDIATFGEALRRILHRFTA